jgi:hypothetical protein
MLTIKAYPTGIPDTPYLATVEVPRLTHDGKSGQNDSELTTVVLLDASGSMGQNVGRIVSDYLPNALQKAGYKEDQNIHLVTFSDLARHFIYSLADMRQSKHASEGSTYMSPGIHKLTDILLKPECKKIRLLSISDGELHDQVESMRAATKLATILSDPEANRLISSKALRLFTSSSQPDTRGLSSLLQLDNLSTTDKVGLIDVQASSDRSVIIDILHQMLVDSLGHNSGSLTTDNPVFLRDPWSNPSAEYRLSEGLNTFWFKDLPTNLRFIVNTMDGKDVKNGAVSDRQDMKNVLVDMGETLGFESYDTVLKVVVDRYLQRLRILKVLSTTDAAQEVSNIVQYFSKLETVFERKDAGKDNMLQNNLQSRLAYFRCLVEKKNRSVSMRMAEIANDNKVSQMNSAQQANYLRTVDTSLTGKSLAKRAVKTGLDFDSVAIAEVKAMKLHLSELDGIDDSNHYISFYSQESTLQGIKAVCALVDSQNTIDKMSALEILQLLNIVGIPCIGPIGDFPDPKTYHIDNLLLGSFVSMSDVLMVKEGGQTLRDPYHNEIITNVVPFYDDDLIQQFLMKHAKTLLEYTASLGMRNMIVEVPHTYKYTMVGGLWNMACRLDKEKTAINVDVFTKLVTSYKTAVDHLFDYVQAYIKEPSDEEKKENKSYFIGNNGITNMISPMITIVDEQCRGVSQKMQYMPAILRALYSFETYQVVRKFNKSDDDKVEQRKRMLDNLLGIDFTKYGTPLPPLFTQYTEKIKHYETPHVNDQILDDILNRFPWLSHLATLPKFLLYSFKGEEGKKAILDSPTLTDEEIAEILGLSKPIAGADALDLRTFKLYCVVQSFLFHEKKLRVDSDNHRMMIEDCGNKKRMESMLANYVRIQYQADYQSRLATQHRIEKELLANELVELMLKAGDEATFTQLFRAGLTRNHVTVLISDTYQLGFIKLRDCLFDPTKEVENRKLKLTIFVMGTDSANQLVWNKGNAIRTVPVGMLRDAFTNNGLAEYWDLELYPLYKEKNIYLYRDSDKANRHTHCNSKPSFWAFGYATVGAYFKDITEVERQEYMKVHTHCCGIWDGVLVKPA